jgi:hypothetical protein
VINVQEDVVRLVFVWLWRESLVVLVVRVSTLDSRGCVVYLLFEREEWLRS